MKIAVAFTLLAACVAASCAASAPQAVDWSAVSAKIDEIERSILGVIQPIISIANNDNAEVGSRISDLLVGPIERARYIFQQLKDAANDRSLTEGKAKELLGPLKDILAEIQTDLQDELAQLSPAAASQIRDLYYASFASAEEKAQQLYALLRAVVKILAVDWSAVCEKIGEIEPILHRATQQIVVIANNENEAVGTRISDKIEDAFNRIRYIFQQLKDACRNGSMTEDTVQESLGQLKDILSKLQGDLHDDLAQLSAAASSRIRDIFFATYAAMGEKAQQIYALLRQ